MRYTLLGNSGLRVSELCLGTITFGDERSFGTPAADARAQLDMFAEAGGNFVDTASNYAKGNSEKVLGEVLPADRDHWVIGTKYTVSARPGDPNAAGNHRKNLVRSLEASLRSLRTDYIDLLWVHAWDDLTPVEEVMRALDDQVRAGKVHYIGISDAPAWVGAYGQAVAQFRGYSPLVALEVPYSLAKRDIERELLPMARAMGLTVCAWEALGAGLLSGKYVSGAVPNGARRMGDQPAERVRLAEAVADVARQAGVSSAQVALSWLRSRGGVIPIVGARTPEQLADNLGCVDVALDEQALARLDEVSAIDLGFPRAFLDAITSLVHGAGVRERIDVPRLFRR
ncbi:MAG TPA: aldo/keto reductase [Pseudonocardiaceae bacterium]|nr:aldo/keto reductase [Pseudonocardiaceae bacterium]